MQVPLQITFEHVEHSDAVEARIREEVEKLQQFCRRITAARVVVVRPQHRHQKGDRFQVRIQLVVPGAADVLVNQDPGVTKAHEDALLAIRDAFQAARRQLQDIVREREAPPSQHPTEENRR